MQNTVSQHASKLNKKAFFPVFKIYLTTLNHSTLQARITDVHGYFADVVQCLLMCHQWLTEDYKQANSFVACMKYVPKNSRDVVERLTDRNNVLEKTCAEYEKKFKEMTEFANKRRMGMLEKNSAIYKRIREYRIKMKSWQGLREQCMGVIWTRMKEEIKELRDLKEEHEKTIAGMTKELDMTKQLLDTFKAKNAE